MADLFWKVAKNLGMEFQEWNKGLGIKGGIQYIDIID